MSRENIKSMMAAVQEGNVNTFQTNFNIQAKENIGKGIVVRKEAIAGSMFNDKKE